MKCNPFEEEPHGWNAGLDTKDCLRGESSNGTRVLTLGALQTENIEINLGNRCIIINNIINPVILYHMKNKFLCHKKYFVRQILQYPSSRMECRAWHWGLPDINFCLYSFDYIFQMLEIILDRLTIFGGEDIRNWQQPRLVMNILFLAKFCDIHCKVFTSQKSCRISVIFIQIYFWLILNSEDRSETEWSKLGKIPASPITSRLKRQTSGILIV